MLTQLANRLLNHEEQPPEAAWQHIAATLKNDNEEAPLAVKLYDFEVLPPSGTWAIIAAELQGVNQTNRNTGKAVLPMVFKLTAAAAVIGFICLGGLYYFSKPAVNNKLVSLVTVKKNNNLKPNTPTLKNLIKQSVPTQSLALLSKARTVLSAKRRKIFDKNEGKVLRNAVVKNILFADTLLSVMVSTKLIRNENGAVIQNMSLLNSGDEKYIDITSPNGEQTKISSKFLHALVYLRDNNYLDNFQGSLDKSFLESLVWKIKFQSWRKKLLETSFIPSSYNYLDIFQLKELITKEE